MELETPLEVLSWIPRPRLTALRRLGIVSVHDLLTHYPRRHEDRREFPDFPRDETGGPICLCGDVTKTRLMRFGGRKIFEAVIEEESAHALSQPLTCRWFNLHYVQKMIATGQRLVVFGKVKRKGARLVIDHPEFEVIEDDDEILIHFRRIAPVYPATEGLSQRVLRSTIFRLLQEVPDELAEVSGPGPNEKYDKLLHRIHFPESEEELEVVRERLVLSEFFAMQLQIARQRAENRRRLGQRHVSDGIFVRKFLRALPFSLTDAQERVLSEIRADLQLASPMNRLLQGDVGSGKTVIAIAGMLHAIESGAQAALMAPTQILAEQHYAVLRRYLDPLGIRIALRTSARREDNGPLPLFDAPENHVSSQIVVGTHALLYEGAPLTNVGLVVIDEQHKFGVSQRAKLTTREPVPDVLVMTATPIPRTLTMTIYGDLDVSVIDEMPPGRGQIRTQILRDIGEALHLLRQQLRAGRQAYIVYPLIDKSDKLQAKAATKEFEQWRERLQPFTCELLHGRVAAIEKQAVMERFRAGATRALISTTVIEVGVDVANATVMLIENAERFGLSQLHQLRGRIGRGEYEAHCLLLTKDESAMPKLAVLEQTTNGFEIAEADWEMRGPGDLLGTAQSGLPALKIGDLRRDAALMRKARAAATELLESDPDLDAPENQRFRGLVVERQGQIYSQIS